MAVETIDLTEVPGRLVGERLVATPEVVSGIPPRRERRTAHRFQEADGPRDGLVTEASCATCGYGEAGHLALTAPEQEVVTALLNQRQAPALMRRSILRKLTSRLHIAR